MLTFDEALRVIRDRGRETFQLAAALLGDRTEVEVSAEDWQRAKSQRVFGITEHADGSVTISRGV